MLNFVLMRSAFCRGVALYAAWGETACYVHTIPAIFCAIPDRASVYTHTNKDFGAKLRRADVEDGASAYRIGSLSDYGAV